MSHQYDNYIHSLLEPDSRNEPLGGSPLLSGNYKRFGVVYKRQDERTEAEDNKIQDAYLESKGVDVKPKTKLS